MLCIWSLTALSLQAQCTTNTSSFGSATAGPNNTPVTISTCNYTTEYSSVTGLAVEDYELSCALNSDGSQKYITVTDPTGATVLAFGSSPLTYSPSAAGDIRVYWNDDASCATSASCHTTTITCTSCPAPPAAPSNDECANALSFATSPSTGCTFTNVTTISATQSANPSCTGVSNNDDVWFSFTAPSADVTLSYQNFNNIGGTSSGLGYAIYDACGGTEIECDFTFGDASTGSQLVAGGFTVGNTYFIQLFMQGSTSEGTFDFCIQEVACSAPSATVTTVSTTSCPAGVTYTVDVTDLGSASSLTLTTDQGTAPVSVTAPGQYQVGPVSNASSTVVNFTAEHDQDPTCNLSIGGFLIPGCPPAGPTGVTCQNGGSPATAYADELDDLSNWTGDTGTSGGVWNSGSATPSSNTGAGAPSSGSGFIFFEGSGGAGVTASIVSNAIDLTAFEEAAEMSFDIFAYGSYMGTFDLGVGPSPAGPFTSVFSYSGQLQTNNTGAPWAPVGVDMTAYVGQTIYLQFTNTAASTGSGQNWESDFSIDNLVIEACAPAGLCPDVLGLAATALSDSEIEVSFSGSAAATGGYNVEFGPAGFTPGSGTTINVAASPTTISNLAPETAYDFYVTADCGASTSAQVGPASATTNASPPANDECAAAVVLTVGTNGTCTSVSGTNVAATNSGLAHSCASFQGGDVWFQATVPASGNLTVETSTNGGFTDSGMSAYDGCAGAEIECDDDGGSGTMSLIELTGRTPGEVIYFAVWEFGNNSFGTFDICAYDPAPPPPVPANDECADAIALTDAGGNPTNASGATYNTTSATASGVTGTCTDGTADDDVWFSVEIPVANTEVTITVDGGADFDAVLGVYTGSCAGVTQLACVDISGTDGVESYTFTSTFTGGNGGQGSRNAPTVYLVQVYDFFGGGGEFTISVATTPLPVELSHFSARAVGEVNVVEWTAALEEDLYMYTVERSTSATGFNRDNYEVVSDVTPLGTDNGVEAVYSTTDNRPAATTYYRLRAEDLDGTVEYSDLVVVSRGADAGVRTLKLRPNPAREQVTVVLPGSATAAGERDVIITDLSGRVLLQRSIDPSAATLDLELDALAAGVYSVSVVSEQDVTSTRLVVE